MVSSRESTRTSKIVPKSQLPKDTLPASPLDIMVRLSTAPLRALRARPSAQQATRFVAPTFGARSFHISTPRSNAASPASKAPAAGAGLQGNVDLMTGEVIRSANIDVSLPPRFLHQLDRYRTSRRICQVRACREATM